MAFLKIISNSLGAGKATLWTSTSMTLTDRTISTKHFVSTLNSTHPTIWRRRVSQPPQLYRTSRGTKPVVWQVETRRESSHKSWVRFGNELLNITTSQQGIGYYFVVFGRKCSSLNWNDLFCTIKLKLGQ